MYERILKAWQEAMSSVDQSTWFQRLESGDLDLCHYKGYLLETYHHAGLNPQIQGFATLYFKDNHRKIFDMFFKHACSEIGHDLLALQDLERLGESLEKMKATMPLPSTIALNAFVIHQIQFVDPVAYLGYLFHLEFMPTQKGHHYMAKLKQLGVPDEAMTFLDEHAHIDVGHNKMMMKYIEALVVTEEQYQKVHYAMLCSMHLHRRMIEDSLANGERAFGGSAQGKQKSA